MPRCSPRTRTSALPTAWALPRKGSPQAGRCRAKSRTPSRWRVTARHSLRRRAASSAPRSRPIRFAKTYPISPRAGSSRARAPSIATRARAATRAAKGSVTAGNSSQTSDGAGAAVVVSERVLRELGLTPLARWVGFAVGGVAPEVMGVGPLAAIPKVLRSTGIRQDQIDWIELNEAFAAQSLAVIKELDLDPAKVNPLGGAIALGHPLGATGAVRTATIVHGLKRRGQKYGMVTMCVGTGMGAAGLFESV